MRFGNFVVVIYNGRVVCGKLGDGGIYLEYIGDANPIPACKVEPLFEIEASRPFPEHFKVDDFRKFVISTLTAADPVKGPHSAITFCDNCGCEWLDNGRNPAYCPYCKQHAQTAEIKTLLVEVDELREALEDIRSLSFINPAMQPNPLTLTAMLGGIHQIADAALAQEDRNG